MTKSNAAFYHCGQGSRFITWTSEAYASSFQTCGIFHHCGPKMPCKPFTVKLKPRPQISTANQRPRPSEASQSATGPQRGRGNKRGPCFIIGWRFIICLCFDICLCLTIADRSPVKLQLSLSHAYKSQHPISDLHAR